MCLAIFKPAGVSIPEEYLINAEIDNPHGGGIAVDDGSAVGIIKGIFNIDYMLDKCHEFRKYPCAIHFRYATHGAVNNANCHPFRINKRLAVIHNGIIQGFGNLCYSDTKHYTDEMLKPLGKDVLSIQEDYYANIGGSKLVILGSGGRHRIVNERLGHWEGGAWYSNYSYQTPVYTTTDTNTSFDWRTLDDMADDATSWEDYCNYRETERELIRKLLK